MTLFLALAFAMMAIAVWIFKQGAGTSPQTVQLPAAAKQPIRGVEPRLTEEHAEEIAPLAPVHIPETETPVAPSLGHRLDQIERTRTECETDILEQLRLQIDSASEELENIRLQLLYMQLFEDIGYGMHPIRES